VSPSQRKNKTAYAVLAVLFVGAVAFQLVVSGEAVQKVWSEGQHFRTEMITSWTLEVFGHILAPFASLFLGFYVARVRIWDARAWLLLAVLISFSLNVDGANRHDEIMRWLRPLSMWPLLIEVLVYTLFRFGWRYLRSISPSEPNGNLDIRS
jgi:hypothetical protein